MIIDSLEAFDRYAGLNPLFPVVADFLRRTNLSALPVGKTQIQGDDIFVNVQEAPVKSREEARFETHRRMIDIQIPFTDEEEHGWTPASQLPMAEYDEGTDMTLHDPKAPSTPADIASTYFTLRPGQFVIYFPTDGHAPAITATGLRKAIIKVKASIHQ
ncbi:MAG: YhcH/YjgK/YiaL family protein [Bacteroidaceae bacterium]|nr:YhcH/YjgK/YiaL family protein [Bacteroidaceae bacterium]MBQ9708205.1 YhcH/YjgK/YiaL family protein [Bacillota bacterium]